MHACMIHALRSIGLTSSRCGHGCGRCQRTTCAERRVRVGVTTYIGCRLKPQGHAAAHLAREKKERRATGRPASRPTSGLSPSAPPWPCNTLAQPSPLDASPYCRRSTERDHATVGDSAAISFAPSGMLFVPPLAHSDAAPVSPPREGAPGSRMPTSKNKSLSCASFKSGGTPPPPLAARARMSFGVLGTERVGFGPRRAVAASSTAETRGSSATMVTGGR